MALFTYCEGSHFISCLHLVDQNIRPAQKGESNIRWIVIGLHDALYFLLIEKLTRTDGFGIYNDNFEKKIGEFYKAGSGSNSPAFWKLLEDSESQNIAGIGRLLSRADLKSGASVLKSGASAGNPDIDSLPRPSLGLNRLKEMRDFFSHPRPMLSGYYEDWLIGAFEDTISVLNEVLAIPGETRVRHDTEEAKIILNSIEFYISRWKAMSKSTES